MTTKYFVCAFLSCVAPTLAQTTYIIDRYGRIVFKLRGTTNWDTEAAREILRALSEDTP